MDTGTGISLKMAQNENEEIVFNFSILFQSKLCCRISQKIRYTGKEITSTFVSSHFKHFLLLFTG
jgi:hypothetical protein